jgi:mono/diheme cytochrome c family protein/cytochrome bd-type quinol oxidase subunit 1
MGTIAILHVFVSHFAIGGGLYLVLSERAARRRGDTGRLAFLERLSRFFVLLSLVFGALSGVAIWFVIGLLNPAATEALIHNFVWGWAIEWTFFVVEVLAAILYYYGWKRLSARDHMALGWAYFAAAFLSLVVINGIVTFMLTPGDWLASGAFLDGFLNPTYWPSLLLRTAVCVMLAGLFALFVAARHPDAEGRRSIVREAAVWGLVGLLGAAGSFLWYRGVDVLGTEVPTLAARSYDIASRALELMPLVAAALGAGLLLGLLWPRAAARPVAVVLLALGLVAFGSFEWFRESMRKPWVIRGYMYANGLEVAAWEDYERDGLLPHMAFRGSDEGQDLFGRACGSCHTLDGYNGLVDRYAGTDPDFIAGTIRGLHTMRGLMPPFPGTAQEREAIASWIHRHVDRRHLSEITGLEGVALGRAVYDTRCGICHVLGGDRDVSDTLGDLDRDDLDGLLSDTEMAEEMPDFTGDAREREALIRFMLTLGKGGRP